MTDVWVMILMGAGTFFILLAAVGVIRMPDYYLRVSVSTKASTLGVGLAVIATGVYFESFELVSRSSAIILFLFLTAPVGAHMLARACYKSGISMWQHSVADDLEGKYNLKDDTLSSGKENPDTES